MSLREKRQVGVQISASINENLSPFIKKIDALADHLDSLTRNLSGITQLTKAMELMNAQLAANNALRGASLKKAMEAADTKENTRNIRDETRAIQENTKARKALATATKDARAKIALIEGSNKASAMQRGAIVARELNKAKTPEDMQSLLAMMPSGIQNNLIKKQLEDQYLKPLIDKLKKQKEDEAAATIKQNAAAEKQKEAAASLKKAAVALAYANAMGDKLTVAKTMLDKLRANDPEGKIGRTLADARQRALTIAPLLKGEKNPEMVRSLISTIGSSIQDNKVRKELEEKFLKPLTEQTTKANISFKKLTQGIADVVKYTEKEVRELDAFIDAKRSQINKSNALANVQGRNGPVDIQRLINLRTGVERYTPSIPDSADTIRQVFSARNMKAEYGFDTAKFDTAPVKAMDNSVTKLRENLRRTASIRVLAPRAQKESLDFSSKLYNSYAKIGEVLFRIQYATLTIAQLSGLLAFGVASDTYMQIEDSIGRVSKNANEFRENMAAVRDIARDTYMSYQSVAGIFGKIGAEASKYNLDNEGVLKLTRTISVLAAVGGTNQSTDQALYQFQQSIASGKFGGDELRSVSEGAPILFKALAAGMQGTSIANANTSLLRPDMNGGKNVSTADIIRGLNSDAVQKEVDKLERAIRGTFTGAMTNLYTSIVTAAGKINQVTGASVGINKLSKFIDDLFFMEDADFQRQIDGTRLLEKAKRDEIIAYEQTIKQTRDFIEALVVLAGSFLAVKGAGLAKNALGTLAFGKTLADGTQRAGLLTGTRSAAVSGAAMAGAVGPMNPKNPISKVVQTAMMAFGSLGGVILKVVANIGRLLGPVGLFITGLQVLWWGFDKLLRKLGMTGNMFTVVTGWILMLGDALASIGKSIQNFLSGIFGAIGGFFANLYNGLPAPIRNFVSGVGNAVGNVVDGAVDLAGRAVGAGQTRYNRSGLGNTSTRGNLVPPPQLGALSSTSGPITPPSDADPTRSAPSRAAQLREQYLEAVKDAVKFIQDIRKSTENIKLEGVRGSVFQEITENYQSSLDQLMNIFDKNDERARRQRARIADLSEQLRTSDNPRQIRSLQDRIDQEVRASAELLQGVPQSILNSFNEAMRDQNIALLDREIRNITSSRLQELISSDVIRFNSNSGTLISDANTAIMDILKDAARFINGTGSQIEYLTRLSNFGGDAINNVNVAFDYILNNTSEEFAPKIREILDALRLAVDDTVKQTITSIDRLRREMSLDREKSNRESIFSYNLSARGIFGRAAEVEKERFDLQQRFRSDLNNLVRQDNSNFDAFRIPMTNLEEQVREAISSISTSTSQSTSVTDETGTDVVVTGRRLNALRDLFREYRSQEEDLLKREELRRRLLSSPWIGAKKAVEEYLESVRDVAAQVNGIFTNAFSSLEDLIVNFIQTGEFQLRDFLKNIVNDVTRLLVRQKIMQPLVEFISSKIPNIFGQLPQESENSFNNMTVTAANVYVNGMPAGGVLSNQQNSNGVSTLDRLRQVFTGNGSYNNSISVGQVFGEQKPGSGSIVQTDETVRAITDPIGSMFSTFNLGLNGFFGKIISIITNLLTMFRASSLQGSGGGGIMDIISFAMSIFSGGTTGQKMPQKMKFSMPKKFHTGTWPTLNRNEIPAILKPDEVVLTSNQTKAVRAGLAASNQPSYSINFSPAISVKVEGGATTSVEEAREMGKIIKQQVQDEFQKMLIKEMGQGGMLNRA